MSGATTKDRVVLTARWIPEKSDSGQAFFSLAYWVTNDWSIGLDYRPLVDEVEATSTFRLLSEKSSTWWRPAVILGTSAEDFTNDAGKQVTSRAWFGTVSKGLGKVPVIDVAVSPYVGAVWLNELDELNPLAGIHLRHKWASLTYQYSGTDHHLTLTRGIRDGMSVGLIYWGLKYPGLSLRYGF